MKQIAFIGLGHMGAPMATNLLKAGYLLNVFDLVQSAVDGLLAAGARWSVRDFRELRIVREDDRLYCQHRHPATTGSERSVGVP
ncbi:hypothetical protein HKW75_30755 [Pseudomonas aeruginosa]|nr:hypothetical protein [Pseudomonas aeruginosa]